jgi:hypothetical protein
VNNRLSLNLGLRYEYSPWLKGYCGQVGTFDPTSPRPIIVAGAGDQIDLESQFAAPAAYAFSKHWTSLLVRPKTTSCAHYASP